MEERRARPGRKTIRMLLGASALVVVLSVPGPAQGAVTGLVPNFPELLPPLPGTPSGTVDPGFDVCPAGGASCPREVIEEMYRRWRPLDESCDHRAVFALTYLRTTEEFVRTVEADPNFFSDVPWINHEDTVFAEFYFRAYDNWTSGNHGAVPAAWRLAFESARSPDLTGAADLLLGFNAHITRDLPHTLAAVGLVKPDGSSRKPDHDRVNYFLNRVADPLQQELAARYDPYFASSDAEPSPVDEETILLLAKVLRENAWRNAERLVGARTDAERQVVSNLIEAEALLIGQALKAAFTIPGWGPTRDAHCAAQPPEPTDPAAALGATAGAASRSSRRRRRACRRGRKGRRAAPARKRCRKPPRRRRR